MQSILVRIRLSVLVAAVALLGFTTTDAHSQVGTVVGTVTGSEGGRGLPQVQIFFPALEIGALTDNLGRFVILNVPVGQQEIQAELIGRTTASVVLDVLANEPVNVELVLSIRAISLGGIVATGVAAAMPQAEIPFTVEKVNVGEVQPILVGSAAGLIQGKVAGVKVIQGGGQPGDDASIQLRGPTSITGGQSPLIIVDGVITRGSLTDIDPLDIETIEIVKGAAAASLYGSRAQAGVIQITTKRGSGVEVGQTEITVRSSFQTNEVENFMHLTTSHQYLMDASGQNFLNRAGDVVTLPARSSAIALDDGGNGTNSLTAFADNPFPGVNRNPMQDFFNPGNFYSTYVSIAGNEGDTQYRVSGRYQKQEGVIQFHDGLAQTNVRVNLDHRISDKLQFSASTYVADIDQDVISQGEQGLSGVQGSSATGDGGTNFAPGGILRAIGFMSAGSIDLASRDANGELFVDGDPLDYRVNPLYAVDVIDQTRQRQRVMGSFDLSYRPTNWLTLQGDASYDRSDITDDFFQPSGYKRTRGRTPLLGRAEKKEEQRLDLNSSFTALFTGRFGDLTARSQFRYLVEDQSRTGFRAAGSGFPVGGVPSLGLISGALTIDSFERNTRSQGLFLISALTYKSKYIADFLVRQDGSSLFGAEERWQTYFRVSTAWRMAEESWWPFDFISEFKPRYSIGTSGGRPGFDWQYETYDVSAGQITPGILGNSSLKPERATEQEYGIDAVIADRLRFQINYVDTKVEDQLLLVPLASYFGFSSQWQNAGTIESTTWEGTLEAAIIESNDMLWTARLNLDRTRSVITELGVPDYEIRDYRARMLIKEGEVLGTFYGTKFANSCADLPSGADCGQFQVNDDNLLVWTGSANYTDGMAQSLWGTEGETGGTTYRWGQPIKSILDGGFTKLGESAPDLNVSLVQDLTWGNFGVGLMFDGEFGGQIYNQTRQWCSRSHCGGFDQAGKPDELKKPIGYYGATGLYNRNLRSSWYTEDGDYIKLRELSVRYTIEDDNLPFFLLRSGISRATINFTGRNLKTWTDYTGYDPEVGKSHFGGSAAVGRIDEYVYPNYRSFGLDIELVF